MTLNFLKSKSINKSIKEIKKYWEQGNSLNLPHDLKEAFHEMLDKHIDAFKIQLKNAQ
jgi:hypothetical protein